MSGYRKAEPIPEDPVAKEEEDSGKTPVYDLTGKFKNDRPYACPFCTHKNMDRHNICNEEFDATLCSPGNRIFSEYIEGPWWWFKTTRRVECNLGGYHDHYRCKTCGAAWIVRLKTPDKPAKIGYLP